MKKYVVLQAKEFHKIDFSIDVINQILDNEKRITGWVLLEFETDQTKEDKINYLGGFIFNNGSDYMQWVSQFYT